MSVTLTLAFVILASEEHRAEGRTCGDPSALPHELPSAYRIGAAADHVFFHGIPLD